MASGPALMSNTKQRAICSSRTKEAHWQVTIHFVNVLTSTAWDKCWTVTDRKQRPCFKCLYICLFEFLLMSLFVRLAGWLASYFSGWPQGQLVFFLPFNSVLLWATLYSSLFVALSWINWTKQCQLPLECTPLFGAILVIFTSSTDIFSDWSTLNWK